MPTIPRGAGPLTPHRRGTTSVNTELTHTTTRRHLEGEGTPTRPRNLPRQSPARHGHSSTSTTASKHAQNNKRAHGSRHCLARCACHRHPDFPTTHPPSAHHRRMTGRIKDQDHGSDDQVMTMMTPLLFKTAPESHGLSGWGLYRRHERKYQRKSFFCMGPRPDPTVQGI